MGVCISPNVLIKEKVAARSFVFSELFSSGDADVRARIEHEVPVGWAVAVNAV